MSVDIKSKLIKAVSEDKAELGSERVVKLLLHESPSHVILSKNCPKKEADQINYYSRLSKTPVTVLSESSVELGSILGKPYSISSVALK